MHKRVIWRSLRLLLAAGLCLGALATAGAVNGSEAPARPEAVPAADIPGKEIVPPEGAVELPASTEEQLKAAEEEVKAVEARQRQASGLLARRGLTGQQREALTARMGEDPSLLQLLEQEKLTCADLVCLALPNSRSDRLDRYRAWAAEHPELKPEETVLQVNMDRDQDFYNLVMEAPNPDSLAVLVNKHYTLPAGYVPELEALGSRYGSGSLRPEAAQAFRAMSDAARADGISLRSVSAYRSYKQQTNTYSRYRKQYVQATVDTFSARPGHSEHQTGLALDINVASTRAHFENTPAYAWLKAHCAEYGFILRYAQGQEAVTGYRFEPWHYRYVGKETAKAVMEQGITYEEYAALQPAWGAQKADTQTAT